jgi:hypothetical protein
MIIHNQVELKPAKNQIGFIFSLTERTLLSARFRTALIHFRTQEWGEMAVNLRAPLRWDERTLTRAFTYRLKNMLARLVEIFW